MFDFFLYDIHCEKLIHEFIVKLLATKFSIQLVDFPFWGKKEGKTPFEEIVTFYYKVRISIGWWCHLSNNL